MKVAMIGLDTSHCPAFTRILNDPTYEYHLPGARVVSAFPGGSALFSLSRERVAGFTEQLRDSYEVRMCDSIAEAIAGVDAILLESVDGRQHLAQFREMAVGKPVFIDKPFAVSTAEARDLIELAARTNTPLMSCSSLRFARGIADLVPADERIVACEAFGPATILDDYPGHFWYGIHSAEILFSFMGAGCQQVRCLPLADMDLMVGEWVAGRVGVVRGTRFEKNEFGCVVHTAAGVRVGRPTGQPPNYVSLMEQVLQFFERGVSPVAIEETFGIVAFLEAVNRSREREGQIIQCDPLSI